MSPSVVAGIIARDASFPSGADETSIQLPIPFAIANTESIFSCGLISSALLWPFFTVGSDDIVLLNAVNVVVERGVNECRS